MFERTPQDQFINVGDIRTRFWAIGDKGSYVLLLHGIAASIEFWNLNIQALAKAHRVVALDMVGFGHTDKPSAPYSLSYFARFVKDFMDIRGIGRAHVVGFSLGGGVALRLAIDYPEVVEKLVLVDSVGLGKEAALLLRSMAIPGIGSLLSRPNKMGSAMLYRTCFQNKKFPLDPLIDLGYRLSALPGAQQAFLSTMKAVATIRGVRKEVYGPIVEHLPNIHARTLIVWGQQDRILPVAHAHLAAKRLPHSETCIFDPCGHLPHIEKSEKFNEVVGEFLGAQ